MRLFGDCCPACAAAEAADCGPGGHAVQQPGRRGLLRLAAGLLAAPALATPALFTPALAQNAAAGGVRRISILRAQTNDRFEGIYWRDGHYDREALRQLDWLMRDPRRNEATPMDPRLFDIMVEVQRRLDSDGTWEITSGFRAPETNAARARQSRAVARSSLHMSGMAADCRLPGRQALGIARTAAAMQMGGVGLYRRDGFVHLDCGPARRW